MLQRTNRTRRVKTSHPTEAKLQIALVKWASYLGLPLIHIANEGKRTAYTGHLLKQMGMTPGVSDLFLAKPAGAFHGYWIELKRVGNKPTENQELFLSKMRINGYKAEWFDDWEKASESILKYLEGKE